jgi:hypothetical protein
MSMSQWTILTLDPKTTDEADLRRTLANKLKGVYELKFYKAATYSKVEVAVVKEEDAITVQEAFDVIDKNWGYYFYNSRAPMGR